MTTQEQPTKSPAKEKKEASVPAVPIAPEIQLHQKILKIIQETGLLPKDGHNDYHNYDYTTERTVVEALRQKFVEHRITVTYEVDSIEEVQKETDKKRQAVLYKVWFTFYIFDVDTGFCLKRKWLGMGEDSSDKGIYKAYTGGQKYFIMKNFMIPTGDDPEGNPPGSEKGEQKTGEQQKSSGGTGATGGTHKGNFGKLMGAVNNVKTVEDFRKLEESVEKRTWTDDEENKIGKIFTNLRKRFNIDEKTPPKKEEPPKQEPPKQEQAPPPPEEPPQGVMDGATEEPMPEGEMVPAMDFDLSD